jgi:hypothetical protein
MSEIAHIPSRKPVVGENTADNGQEGLFAGSF